VAFQGSLFAQDEIQVAEHPALGHLVIKLRKKEMEGDFVVPKTRMEGRPTPILIRGIERRVQVNVDMNAREGRPRGLYGNMFSSAPIEVIKRASVPIVPPTITHMICMAALGHGNNEYTHQQIVDLFTTAFTSFKAAKIESTLNLNSEKEGPITPKVVVHTGNWGTGAFGGSKPLIAAIQCSAALCAGVDELVYHTFNEEGTRGYEEGFKFFQELVEDGEGLQMEDFISRVVDKGYRWGVGDGN